MCSTRSLRGWFAAGLLSALALQPGGLAAQRESPSREVRPLLSVSPGIEESLRSRLYTEYRDARYNLVRGYLPSDPELGTRVPSHDSEEFFRLSAGYGKAVAWTGPEGKVSLLSLPLFNDPEQKTPGSYRTVLMAEDGKVLREVAARYTPLYMVDFEGDGIPEVVFLEGIGYWEKGEWHLPPPRSRQEVGSAVLAG